MICLLFAGMNEGLEFLFSDLEENFKYIKAKEESKNYPLMPASYFPQTNVLGFTNSLLEKMMSIISYEADSVALAEDSFLSKDLAFVRSFLVDVIRQWDENGKLQALQSRVAMVVYETEFVLDSVVAGDADQSLVVLLNFIKEEIKLIKVEAMETFLSKGLITELQNITKTYSKMPVASGILVFNEPVVGLNDEVQKIIDRLTRGTQHLNIVSIVGMAGLGKTTLAQKVYSHNSIIHHFHARSWCCVSQVYNIKRLLLDILSGISGYSVDKHSEMNEDDLAHKLYQHLKKKRYLIVLDDVWDIQVWNSLENSFPDDKIESRVLLTSRHQNVASQIKPNSEPHNLRSFTNVESWELLKKKICFEGDCASEILTLGKEIAQLCKGLPLMILIVAGILSNTKQDTWKKVAESLKKGTLSIPEQCRETLEMSYSHLPDYLKPCFLYFGAFEEDQQIPLQELLWLWIAEGFVEKTDRECLEDVAERYMMELIQRSLVMITKKEFIGKAKSCVLHDLLLDFCKAKCNEEQFLHCLHGYELNTSINQSSFHRLRIHYGREDHLESRLLCPRLHTLFFVGDYNIRYGRRDWYDTLLKFCQSKLLRVLELRTIRIGPFFPRVIESLVHLRYLALYFRTSDAELTIPSSIDSLSNLETFIVEKSLRHVSLPDTVWNMKKLRHLFTTGSACWTLSEENLEFRSNLENLETLSAVQFSCGHRMMEIMRKFPNIRTLKYKLIMAGECGADCNTLALDFMSQLESLTIFQVHQKFLDLQCFQLPWKLKKLVLSGLCFPWSKISAIDRLPNLEVLKLVWNAFTGEIWDMEEGKFPRLRFLKLADMDLAKWTDTDDNFPCLEKLVLDGCPRLNEVPSSLAYISTLQMIEVSCCKSVTSSIKQIHKEQMDMGNEDLKIFIHPS